MNDELDTLQKVELALLRAEHQKRFQVQIAFVKEKVGEGVEYRNPLMRVVVSNEGAYYEFNDLPEEFCGATGDEIRQHAISQPDALARFAKAVASIKKLKPHNARHFQLMAIYTRRGLVDRTNCFIYDWDVARAARGQPPTEVGKYQPSVMPLFFKIKMDADFSKERSWECRRAASPSA